MRIDTEVKFVNLLQHKETGKIHCPSCLKELIDLDVCFACNKCKKYYGKRK